MSYDARIEDGQRPERDLGPVPAAQHARVGLDVPIEAKLHAPGTRREWVERPGLRRGLAAVTAKLVLVTAPAGAGKTTIVAQWRCGMAEDKRFAWVSLDRGDDDPARLWWYVVSALQRACPELGAEGILRELRVRVPDITGTVLPVLAGELAALSEPVVLVLDDFHVITERSCHDQVAFLLAHLPPMAQVVLVTRADPPLRLARLRATGQMAELRAQDLRFTPGQAAALVHAVAGVRLSEPDLAALVDRTEGWPAGVYLAALSLRGHPSPSTFIGWFRGDNRFVADYLASEVLSRQSCQIQQFLTRTSILTRFCAPLCDAVTGSANAGRILEVLERENLFLVPLDDHGQWYRYHNLFGQLLRSQLARTEQSLIATLHKRASDWHRLSGTTEEAVSHALAAGDAAQAVDLIARHWHGYADAGRTATVRGWMRSLGDDQIAANPAAAHCAAMVAALSGDRTSVRRWLPVIETGDHGGPLPDGIRSLKSSAALLRGVYGFDGLPVMRESAATAAELENDRESPWYALARGALGFSLYLSGEATAAARPLEEAVRSGPSPPLIRMFALSLLSLVWTELGRLSDAQDLAEAARALATRGDLARSPQSSLPHTAAGAVYARQGQLDDARNELEHALQLRRKASGISPWATLVALLLLARVVLEMGDSNQAKQLADEARERLTAQPGGTDALQAKLAELDRQIAGRERPVPAAGPLTDREVAVLRQLAGTLSRREIGWELSVSANTIKTHTQKIYRKLGVTTRHDAVVRARHLGIR